MLLKEKEIFALIATGYDNTQIAEKIYIAEQTVRNYVSNIYSKLGIKDRFQIIQLANQIKSKNTVSEWINTSTKVIIKKYKKSTSVWSLKELLTYNR